MAIWKCGICGEIFFDSFSISAHLFINHINNSDSVLQNQTYEEDAKEKIFMANIFKISLN